MSVYENHSVIDHFHLDKLRAPTADSPIPMGRARRFHLPSITSATTAEPTYAQVEFELPHSIELPTINPAYYLRPYRYAYGINRTYADTFADHIIKLDMQDRDGGQKVWGIRGYTPSEPIFVPRPGGEAEDDGVVLSVVLDESRGRSMLIVLDARDMKECARAEMETVFPIGFHGVWAQNESAL